MIWLFSAAALVSMAVMYWFSFRLAGRDERGRSIAYKSRSLAHSTLMLGLGTLFLVQQYRAISYSDYRDVVDILIVCSLAIEAGVLFLLQKAT